MMRRAIHRLAPVVLFGVAIALLIWSPPRSFDSRIDSLMAIANLGVAIGSAAVGAVIVRHHILWPDRPSLGSPSALIGPFHRMSPQVAAQCSRLAPQRRGPVEYWPCSATLASGTTIPRCVLIEASQFDRHWRGQRVLRPAVRIEFITTVEKSAIELPEPILSRYHEAAAQLGDDQHCMRFVFRDGRNVVIQADEFPALPEFPIGLDVADVLDVLPEAHPSGPIHAWTSATLCVFRRAEETGG